jgi:hypothetical protein
VLRLRPPPHPSKKDNVFMADITIKLADREFKISGLTIRQSCDLRIGEAKLPDDDGAKGWANLYDLSIRTIAIAINEHHPDITEDELWKMRFSEKELTEARKAIAIHSGFRSPDPTIAELRATIAAKKIELTEMEKTLKDREDKAKVTGEG